MKLPEHEKLAALGNRNQELGEFIEWLNEQGLTICALSGNEYYRARLRTEQLLALYFGINLNKLEKEKQQLLESLRS